MTFDLSSITRSTQLPPRIVVYGVPGIGKTTFAANAPGAVFLPVEDGLGQLDVPTFPRPASYLDVLNAIGTLLEEEHSFTTFVIDGLDKLEFLIWTHTCEASGKGYNSIEDFGYHKGYTIALEHWRHLLEGLDALREQGVTICLIGHSSIVKFEAPDADAYDRYQLQLHKHAVAAVERWADAILFANYEVTVVAKGSGSDKKRGVGRGDRVVYTTERPAWTAKNRYGMPDRLPLEWAAVAEFTRGAPEQPAPKNAKKTKQPVPDREPGEDDDIPF